MQSEKQIEAAARAICAAKGLNPDCLHQINVFDGKEHFDSEDDRGRRYVIGWRLQEKFARAALEAALSAAEPVGWQWRNPRWTVGDQWQHCPDGPREDKLPGTEYRPVYAAPPAPSVAVEHLITEVHDAIDEYREGMKGDKFGPHEWPTVDGIKTTVAQSLRRSALSAQVQDAASGEGRQFSTITDEMVMAGCIAAYGKDFQEWPENSIHDGKVMVSKVLRAAIAAAPAKQEG